MKYCKKAIQCGGFTPRYQRQRTTKTAKRQSWWDLVTTATKDWGAKYLNNHRNIVVWNTLPQSFVLKSNKIYEWLDSCSLAYKKKNMSCYNKVRSCFQPSEGKYSVLILSVNRSCCGQLKYIWRPAVNIEWLDIQNQRMPLPVSILPSRDIFNHFGI